MSDEIQKAQTTAMTKAPDFIPTSGDGFENVRGKDLAPPRLQLMQAMSPAIVNEEGDFKIGDVVNSLTGELVFSRDQEISFVPVYHFVSWIEWGEDSMLDISMDPNSEIARAAALGEKTMRDGKEVLRVTEYHNFFIIATPIEEPLEMFHLAFAKTNYKIGRKLIGLAKMRGHYPLYAGQYKLSSENEENKRGQKYRVFGVRNDGWVDEPTLKVAAEQYDIISKAMKENRVDITYEDAKHEDPDKHDTGGGEF